jgi:pimeloyl-ACP methyl ester carboxylesterase
MPRLPHDNPGGAREVCGSSRVKLILPIPAPQNVHRRDRSAVVVHPHVEGLGGGVALQEAGRCAGGVGRSCRGMVPRRPLKLPVQIIGGREDRVIPVSHAEALGSRLPVHIEQTGHLPRMEKAGEVNRLIKRLIENQA